MYSEKELKQLGARLVELRQAKQVSASLVAAEALGYGGSHVAVTRLERGILAEPREDHLHKLAAYYGVEFESLWTPTATTQEAARVKSTAKRSAQSISAPALAAKLPKQRKPLAPRTLAERVLFVRQLAGLEVPGFAAAVKAQGAIITEGDVTGWEAGTKTPNPIQLRAMALFTKRSTEWFHTGVDDDDVPVAVGRAPMQPQAFASIWRQSVTP